MTVEAKVDEAAFRRGMRSLVASVSLVTTERAGVRSGLTATAVCSVSGDPPQLLVCINKRASAHDPIGEAGYFCVNVLAPKHRPLAELFGGRAGATQEHRFGKQCDWSTLTTGAPVLVDCPASFDCTVSSAVTAGTHTIYIGRIVDIALNCQELPLVYAHGSFVHGAALGAAALPASD